MTFRTLCLVVGALATAWAGVAGCSEDEGGGDGGATPSGSTTSTTSTTSSSTSTQTNSSCSADLTQSLGATTECNDCMTDNCCAVAEAFDANPSAATYEALGTCGLETYTCGDVCPSTLCASTIVFWPFSAACAACQDDHCCDPLNACLADATCVSCFTVGEFEPSCCSNAAYLDIDECWQGTCGSDCATSLLDRSACGGGGSGGAAGGSGGAGGASGGSGGGGGS